MRDLRTVPNSLFTHNLFDELFHGFLHPQPREEKSVSNLLIPLADIVETEFAYSVRVEMPGLKKSNIYINFNGGVLTISGESDTQTEEDGEIIHQERTHRSYRRTMRVPHQVDTENIHAEFVDGLLEVVLPKLTHADQTDPMEIEVT
ncbi:MAG: Hsp20/alpha crystallin family protein [Gammaproteobacteria bacterium]|jgi:HSP20 family protein|nr:Hsp20/alpha crystallin family protein [Gammaproteobacteria bacterium]MBT4606075.1 Hsp20/alpha crystallin family protein [Thiotrichales bacterium]MBT3471872.1 Hsp20/alpha crystallin family protein [Gammaproteobacteria bacterium]MBT3967119.1 Hsp20/alpha crystallin family protein [Gammaproteobacteria bacterium]MBT4082015.1 Hsp20/alpha crystallin family protein [Gammaproteobacteria bacterium]